MRRLFWLGLGVLLAWYGFGLIAGGDGFATYRLRDGLIVALLGAILFAWNTGPFASLPFIGGERQWPMWGRLFAGTGIICGAASALLFTLWSEQSWALYLGASLWGVGALALVIGLCWPGRVEIYPAPAYRWGVDAAGNYVRYALDDPNQPPDSTSLFPQPSPYLSSWRHPIYWLLVIVLLGIGTVLRVWHLATMPPSCVDVECALALRLVEGGWPQGFHAEAVSLFALLTTAVYRFSGESIERVALGGCDPRHINAANNAVGGALLYETGGRTCHTLSCCVVALGSVEQPFWDSVECGSITSGLDVGDGGRALQRPSYRWWGMTGISLALLLMQPLPLWGATLGWIAVLAGAAVWAQRQMPIQTQSGLRRAWIDHAALMVGCALGLGLPVAIPFMSATMQSGVGTSSTGATNNAADNAIGQASISMVAGLLDSGGATLDFFTRQPLLPAWTAALALLGLATLLRWAAPVKGGQPRAAVVGGGMILYGASLLMVIPAMSASAMVIASASTTVLSLPIVGGVEAWLVLLPFIALAIGVAADQLFTTFDRSWSILLPLPRVVAVVMVVLIVVAGRETLSLMGQLGRSSGGGQNETEVAMGQFLARCLRGEATDDPCNQQGEGAPIFYVPVAAANHPATRLLLGAALESGRVRSFDPSRDLLPSTTPTGDLFFLVGLENQPVIDLLRQLYPNAQLRAEPTDRVGPTLFVVIQIPLEDVLAHQGLEGRYFVGAEAVGNPMLTRMDGPLRFLWRSDPPLDGPFNVLWEGSLLVPSAGSYQFAFETANNDPSGADVPVISLQLDGNLVLDSSLGLNEQTQNLAEGAYQFTMRYRTNGAANNWAVRWTPPGGTQEVIERTQFYSPALPNIGLIGTYYEGSNWDGAVLTTRKDMILGAPVDLPMPYSVYWTGKLAASRAGEYFFAVTANGPVTLLVDGRETLAHVPSSDITIGPGYSQASIYLEQGWHTIDLRYAPANSSDLRLLWQPPGSGPLLLASRYLLPTQAPITMSDVSLPPAPELMDARLGNDQFALTANLEPFQPIGNLPPVNLPLLVSEPVWTLANGCGAGDFQFATPRGLAVDAQNGRLYIADSGNRRVVELMLGDGSYVTSYTLSEFQEPVDVAIDPGGALLVLDATVQNIFRIDRATGESAAMTLGASFYHPRGFDVDWAGNLAVADTGGARVVVLDATGAFLNQYGGPDTGLGQGQPSDVLALNDQLWAIAADHGRLWQLDSMGSVTVSDRASTVNGPQLTGLPDGSGFFMSDPVRRTILYFAPSGQPLGQLGYSDRFASPMGVAASFGEDGFVNLFVGDSATCALSLWRLRMR